MSYLLPNTDDVFIQKWRDVIRNEVDLQARCFSGDPSRIEEYRKRNWNLYFLGHLKERLVESLSGRDISIDPFVYPYGRGPDTILYFGRSRLPAYLEINQDGRLNLKVYLEDLATETEKKERVQKVQNHYHDLLENHKPRLKTRKLDPRAKSKTIMWFDVDLIRRSKRLFYSSTHADTIGSLTEILETFYGNPPLDDIDIDPSVHPPYF
jgi:hypothetical protein